jgi:hypothetical protein
VKFSIDSRETGGGGDCMPNKKGVAWAVEYVENGKRIVSVDSIRYSTPEEAKRAFEESRGIPWKELERRGAKVVQQGIPPELELPH